jgi:hypothetical protein
MRPAGLRALVVVAVAVAVVVGLWALHGTASAQAPAANTITTELRPGWNVIGWLGSGTTVDDLFRAVPALELVAAWDAEAGRYAWGRRDGKTPSSLEQLPRGQGLYLRLAGTEPVQWTRPAAEGAVLLRLHAGHNLVTWGGPDGTPIAEAVDWLGDAVVGASRWNADRRESERYRPGAPSSANTLRALNHGDALWVRLSEDASWWQSGTAGTEFVFEESVPAETQLAIREETARVLAFFAERYGIEPPQFSVLVDPERPETNAAPRMIQIGRGWADDEDRGFALAHEYFHVLQFDLSRYVPNGSPTWLTEGTAKYVEDLYNSKRRGPTGARLHAQWWQRSLPYPELRLTYPGPIADTQVYYLGALATDWLLRRAASSSAHVDFTPFDVGDVGAQTNSDAHIRYYRLLASSATWQAAFEAAFGISAEEFGEAFALYRRQLNALRLAHLADDRDEPVLVLLGEISPGAEAAVRAEFGKAQTLFRERFASDPVEYTVYVAASEGAGAEAYRRIFGGLDLGVCVQSLTGIALFMILENCQQSLAHSLGSYHVDHILKSAILASVGPGSYPYPPHWLLIGAMRYAEQAYRKATGLDTFDRVQSSLKYLRGMTQPLSSMEMPSGVDAAGLYPAHSLSYVAVDWLAARAGEPALFEYYRLLGSSATWQETFEVAFDIAIDDFYAEFEEYLREIALPPLPHQADDLDEPILVLVGDVFPRRAVRFRTEFRNLQVFFRDRFGGGPADYTLYVAADVESAAGIHRALGGTGAVPCGSWGLDTVLLLLSCDSSFPVHLARYQSDAVMRAFAPLESLPQTTGDYDPWGPEWLQRGTVKYVDSAYRATTGHTIFARVRGELIGVAREVTGPLSTIESAAGWNALGRRRAEALSFLAADWLAQRAGEPALFEYYRLLPSSGRWEEAFEEAFKMAIDDFYAAFAEYRAGL